jgi:hypothetical protein
MLWVGLIAESLGFEHDVFPDLGRSDVIHLIQRESAWLPHKKDWNLSQGSDSIGFCCDFHGFEPSLEHAGLWQRC